MPALPSLEFSSLARGSVMAVDRCSNPANLAPLFTKFSPLIANGGFNPVGLGPLCLNSVLSSDSLIDATEYLRPWLATKIRFLCSFNGSVLPRPSDGSLRYVGGHTRIICVRRGISFAEFMAKMSEVYGGPMVFKYQLAREGLDDLVSVSSQEDLDKMMDEYEKLQNDAWDKYAWLQTFLYPSSEGLDPSYAAHLLDAPIETINEISPSSLDLISIQPAEEEACGILTTTVNSNTESPQVQAPIDSTNWRFENYQQEGINGGLWMSTTTVDQTSAAPQGPSFVAPTNLNHLNAQEVVITGVRTTAATASGTVPSVPDASTMRLRLPTVTVNPPAVASQGPPPIDHTNLKYVNSQQFVIKGGMSASAASGTAPFIADASCTVPSITPATPQGSNPIDDLIFVNSQQVVITGGNSSINQLINPSYPNLSPLNFSTSASVPQVSNCVEPLQLRSESYIESNKFGISPPPVISDRNYMAPTTCEPSCKASNDQNYKVHCPLSALRPLHPDLLQQQTLDNQEQEQLQELPMRFENCNMFQNGILHDHSDAFTQDNGISSAGSVPESNQLFYTYPLEDTTRLLNQQGEVSEGPRGSILDLKFENTFFNRQLEEFAKTKVSEQQYAGQTQSTAKAENLGHVKVSLSSGRTDFPPDVQTTYAMFSSNSPQPHMEDTALQLQQRGQKFVPPQHPVKTEVGSTPIGNDVSAINGNLGASEAISGFKYDYGRMIGGLPESLHTSNPPFLQFNDICNPVTKPIADLTSNSSEVVVENFYFGRPQVAQIPVYPADTDVNPGISDGMFSVTREESVPPSFDVTRLHNLEHPDISLVSTITGNLEHLPEREIELPISNELMCCVRAPPQSLGFDLLNSYEPLTELAIQDMKDDDSQFQISHTLSISPPNIYKPCASPKNNLLAEQSIGFPESCLSEPLFQESSTSKESALSRYLDKGNSSKLYAMLEQGNHSSSLLTTNMEPTLAAKAAELIKQDLESVAEGVAPSVLQSSSQAIHVFCPLDQMEKIQDRQSEGAAVFNGIIWDANNNGSGKVTSGIPNSEDIGRLQIIKYIDLEGLRELGSGSFGTVFHGKWRGTDVAIKRINEDYFAGKKAEQERARTDFWNEACKLAELHHPNVLPFYGVCLDGPAGSLATITEFMVNGSLRHALHRSQKTFDKCKRLLIAMDIAFGVEYLHSKNIVHFDLKTDNLLVNLRDHRHPICKVADLGLSKLKCKTLISGNVRGTLPYMAPELLNGISNLVSEKVDVFSFGVVMWELLTGEEPYADLYYGAIIGGIVNNTLRPKVPDTCDPEWRCLMEQCWSHSPSDRPSFTEIVDRLRSMAASLPTS